MVITEAKAGKVDLHDIAGPTARYPGADSSAFAASEDAGGSGTNNEDLELMTMPSVVGRESGERDPLLLRGSIMSDDTIKGLKQSVQLA
jgi:hypothetical protein